QRRAAQAAAQREGGVVPLRHVGGRPGRGGEEGRQGRRHLSRRPARAEGGRRRPRGAFLLRGEVQGSERRRVRPYAYRLGRRREGRGGEELISLVAGMSPDRTAGTVCSPPPCGEGLGVGVRRVAPAPPPA